MMGMSRRGNAITGLALFPILAAAFAFADEAVTIVYTASYLEAAPVMRLYIVGMAVMVIEVGSVILLLQQGPYALKVQAAALVASIGASLAGAMAFGLTGAALGSVIAIFLDRAATLRRVSRLTGIPLAQLQDWRGLAWSAASAAIAGALAWLAVNQFLSHHGVFIHLVVGTAVLAAAYAALNYRRFR
jgi:O-antigen/teichoic acid export membrane protein